MESTSGTGVNKRLMVNADDFGWSRSVNRGIVETHVNGIVTSASILAAGAGFEDAVELARATPTLELGVHLNFYRGTPVLPAEQVASLLDENGRFLGSWERIVGRLATGRFDLSQLEADFRAAIMRVKEAGITPTHLNSEKHLHLWPSVFPIVAKLAKEFSIPYVRLVREPLSVRAMPMGLSVLSAIDEHAARKRGVETPKATIGVSEPPVTLAALDRLLSHEVRGLIELVVHPGYVDDEFLEIEKVLPNKLGCSREEELAVLASPDAMDLVRAHGFELARMR
jgi:predicted glycoside hydrolase/deacetylase ChbG (UPF0249 family)